MVRSLGLKKVKKEKSQGPDAGCRMPDAGCLKKYRKFRVALVVLKKF